jgi:hypothetical protein
MTLVPTLLVILVIAAITLSVGGRFLTHPDDPRCSYQGGSTVWKIITATAAVTVAGILFMGVM